MPVIEASWPLIFFAFAGLFSPGPNVVMLTASGARFGFRATVPHLLGVPVGTGLLAAVSALGVGAVLLALPGLKVVLQIIASAWILQFAWRIAQAGWSGRAEDAGQPFTFLQGVVFQVVNPKVWAVTLAATAAFGIGLPPPQEAMRQFVIFAGMNLGVCLFWTMAGHFLASVLHQERIWRTFMSVMAVLLALSVVLIFA